MVGDKVAAAVRGARGVRVRAHGVDGLEVDGAGADEADKLVRGVLLGEEVLGILAVNLGHGLDGVAAEDLGVVGAVRVCARDPLDECLLVQHGPDLAVVAGAGVHGLVVGAVDGNLVVDLNAGRGRVHVAPFVMELDGEVVLLLVLALLSMVMGRGAAVDGGGVGPEDGEECGDEEAVAKGALDGVVEFVHGDGLADVVLQVESAADVVFLADAEPVHSLHHASGLAVAAIHVLPGRIRRGPMSLLLPEGERQLVKRHGHIPVRHCLAHMLGMKYHAELAVLHTGHLHLTLENVLHAKLGEVVHLPDLGEVGGLKILLVENLDVLLIESLCLSLLLVEFQSGVEASVVLHIEKLIVVGLENVGEKANRGHRMLVDLAANNGLDQGVRVDAADMDVLGRLIRLDVHAHVGHGIVLHISQIVILRVDIAHSRSRRPFNPASDESFGKDVRIDGADWGVVGPGLSVDGHFEVRRIVAELRLAGIE